jgi:competence protein ComEC
LALIYLSGAFIAGIFLGSRFALPFAPIFAGLVPLPRLFFFPHRRKLIIIAAVCLIAFFGGALCYQASQPPEDGSHIKFYNGQAVEIEGMVSADPEVRDSSTHIRLSVSGINLGGEGEEDWQELSGDVLLFVPRYPEYEYGDVLRVTGELESPTQLGDFDYQGYLEHQGIYATMYFYKSEDIELLETGRGVKPLEWIYSLRKSLAESIAGAMPEPQAALTQGMLLGIRYNIPDDIKYEFAQTGTAHLLAISGLHLSIVAGILLSIGIWLFGKKRFIYIWLALGIIWLYAILTGLHPPIVRGAIMASLFLSAELLGRQRTAATSLAFAAAVMVGIDPEILFDAAFQLSVLAMAGLIFITPPLREWGQRLVGAALGEKGLAVSLASIVSDGFSVTLAATIAVWPLIAHYFGVVSLVGPLVTFLALPALPAIIISGAAAGLVGLAFVPLAQGIGWIAWLFNSYLLFIVGGFATLPISSVEVGSVSPAFIAVYYCVLVIIVWLVRGRGDKAKHWLRTGASRSSRLIYRLPWRWVIPPLVILAALVSAAAITLPDNELHVSFLDIGQGDAILIQRGSQQVLIDGGPSPQTLMGELSDRMPFWDRTIELVVLTHPDDDHISGLVEVLERYRVEQVLYPDLEALDDFNDPLSLYQRWEELIEEKGIACTAARAGEEIELGGGVTMTVLNPPATLLEGTDSDVNNNSAVLRLGLGRVSFLFTGDIMWEAEFGLIARGAGLSSTVLKVAHHGSNTSTTADFLAAVSPCAVVISAGKGNPYGHPRDEVLERLEANPDIGNIFRTDEQGTIEFITDGERLWVRVGKE